MNTKNFSEALGNINTKYIEGAITYSKVVRPSGLPQQHAMSLRWKLAIACTCLCFICVGVAYIVYGRMRDDNTFIGGDRLAENETFSPPTSTTAPPEDEFAPIDSLLAEEGQNASMISKLEHVTIRTKTGTEPYTGEYKNVAAAPGIELGSFIGKSVPGTNSWYAVAGHDDLQYLIKDDNDAMSLWRFVCFDTGSYPYKDVLELVYNITSADDIDKIEVFPAKFDNSDTGKAIQERVGNSIISSRDDINRLHNILSSMICHGANHWDEIDYYGDEIDCYGDESTAPLYDNGTWLGRYLTVVTRCGNEIDSLKYTGVSDMFYEFSGIAYTPLSDEDADTVCEILGIDKSAYKMPVSDTGAQSENTHSDTPDNDTRVDNHEKIEGASMEYVNKLQADVTAAMVNGELPFVLSSSVMENPCRLKIEVNTNNSADIDKLRAYDSLGSALEIVYTDAIYEAF